MANDNQLVNAEPSGSHFKDVKYVLLSLATRERPGFLWHLGLAALTIYASVVVRWLYLCSPKSSSSPKRACLKIGQPQHTYILFAPTECV